MANLAQLTSAPHYLATVCKYNYTSTDREEGVTTGVLIDIVDDTATETIY